MTEDEPILQGPDLVLTMAAVERLREVIADSDDAAGKLRIRVEGPEDDPSYILSLEQRAQAGDTELDFVHVAVLLDAASRQRLRRHEMDHRRSEQGEHFMIRRAN